METRKKVENLQNKIKIISLIKDLKEESNVIYTDLKATRNKFADRQEEMELEMFNIISNMKLLKEHSKRDLLDKYIDEQYEILKKDLFDNDQEDKQAIIKIFM